MTPHIKNAYISSCIEKSNFIFACVKLKKLVNMTQPGKRISYEMKLEDAACELHLVGATFEAESKTLAW